MSPPINIDGSEIQRATIDGQNVNQVTIDGQEVFVGIPDSGVSRWTFDDADTSGPTASDVWGANDGTINGATTGVTGANQTYTTNEAYDFDGANDNVTISGSDFSTISIAAWVFVRSKSDFDFVFDARTVNQVFILGLARSDDQAWRWVVGANEINASVNLNTWQHLIGAFDGSTAEFFVDGSSVGTVSTSKGSTTFTGDWSIGDTNDASGFEIDAIIDDVRVYDKGLSSTEASDLYNTGSI